MQRPKIGPRTAWGALFAAGLLYEVYTLVSRRRGDTLSEQVWAATDYSPMTAFVSGIIAGHWFWPRHVARHVGQHKK